MVNKKKSANDKAIIELAMALISRTCIPFIGAGVSKKSGLPTGGEFLKKNKVGALSWKYGTQVLDSKVNYKNNWLKTFGNKKLKPNELHELLAHLDARYYISTNYDTLFEDAFKAINKTTDLFTINSEKQVEESFSKNNIVIKLHGDVDNQELLVMTAPEYHDRIKHPKYVDKLVELLFLTHTILFIGCSLEDDNILSMLYNCANLPTKNSRSKFILLKNVDNAKRELLDIYNVIPISLNCKNDSQYFECIKDFIFQLWLSKTEALRLKKQPDNSKTFITPKDIVNEAIRLKQLNKLKEVIGLIDTYLYDVDWKKHIDLLADWTYVVISVYDKIENMKELEKIQRRIDKIFDSLQGVASDKVYSYIKNRYRSSVALANIRCLKIGNALKLLSNILKQTAPPISDSDESVLYADQLLVRAIAFISYAAFSKNDGVAKKYIIDAGKDVSRAEQIYKSIKMDGEEVHFKGRLYGTKVYLNFASRDKGIKNFELADPVGTARKGPDESKQRTEYGIIAGLYCLGYSYFKVADEHLNAGHRTKLLGEAKDSITEALRRINKVPKEYCQVSRSRIELLLSFIQSAIEGKENNLTKIERKYNKVLSKLNENLSKDPNLVFSLGKWLGLPLN
jgi:hypothetical protein